MILLHCESPLSLDNISQHRSQLPAQITRHEIEGDCKSGYTLEARQHWVCTRLPLLGQCRRRTDQRQLPLVLRRPIHQLSVHQSEATTLAWFCWCSVCGKHTLHTSRAEVALYSLICLGSVDGVLTRGSCLLCCADQSISCQYIKVRQQPWLDSVGAQCVVNIRSILVRQR